MQQEPLDLGQLLVRQGLVSEDALRECLEIQRRASEQGRDSVPRLGELLVQKGYLTEKQVIAALAAQEKKIYYCPRCDVQVNVSVRPDVREYKCARCEGTLVLPGSIRDLKVVDSSIIFISRDPVPKDVIEAAKDPSRRFGKYILINEVGDGSIGVIHRAWDTYLNQFVAIKMIKPPPAFLAGDRNSWHETRVLSLFKEARSAVRLRHPNIVPIYDVGRISHTFFISMEYLEGATLGDHIKRSREQGGVSPFYEDPKKFLRIIRDVARALHYAHTRPSPIVHCDLKPSNILVDRTGRGYVLDFGLAKDLRAVQQDQPGTIRGTPAYMAPEQAAGDSERIDARTDVYGLGAILYELLAGRPPFVGDTVDVLRQAIREKPLRPSEVLVQPSGSDPRGGTTTSHLIRVPPELEDICLRCLEKEPDNRYASVKEVFEALDEVLRGPGTQRREVPALPLAKLPEPLPAARVETRMALPAAAPAAPKPATRIEPAPVPTPAPPGPSKASWLWVLAGSAATCALLLAGYAAFQLGSNGASAWETGSRQVDAHVAAFRPDLAIETCLRLARENPRDRATFQAAQAEIEWVDRFSKRLLESLNTSLPKIPALRVRDREVRDAKVSRATQTGLALIVDGAPLEVSWGELEPEQLVELAKTSLRDLQPADRYGLGLYLEKKGRLAESQAQFASLLGTDLEIPAKRHLERTGR